MKSRSHLFWSEAVMLIAVTVPLAQAEAKTEPERTPWYLVVTILGVIAAAWTTVRHRPPPLGPLAGKLSVLAACVAIIAEWAWLDQLPAVLTLSHFMILVCVSKLLQQRAPRDDVQVIVLTLLVLAVASIVSSDASFAVVLTVYVAVALNAIIRHHLRVEALRATAGNRLIHARAAAARGPAGASYGGRLIGITALAGLSALAFGAIVFIFVPRFGGGMLGTLDTAAAAGHAVTGCSPRLDFDNVTIIRQSDRPVMRVQIEREDGRPLPEDTQLYFRGTVLEQYGRREAWAQSEWGWRQTDRTADDSLCYRLAPDLESENTASFVEDQLMGHLGPRLIQRYHLESRVDPRLFACYPALEVSSRDFGEVRKWIPDQALQVDQPLDRPTRYTIRSAMEVTGWLAGALARERPSGAAPTVIRPRLPPEREREIIKLIDETVGDVGPLEQAGPRELFVRRLSSRLRSSPFTYTLKPPAIRRGAEPIGAFLLDTHRGHCEYFASALAVMCQLKDIPARVVCGYRGGDYNSLGNFYVVRQKHAHSWVEVFIPGKDWMRFDPTPAASEGFPGSTLWFPQLRRYLSYFHFLWSSLVVDYDLGLRRQMFRKFQGWLRRPAKDQRTVVGAVAAFARELFGWRLALSWRERLIYWVFALLAVSLALLIGYIVLVVVWWLLSRAWRWLAARSGAAIREREAEFYYRFCRRLAALGLRRRADQTPAEFARDLAGRSPLFEGAPALVDAYYEVVYGRLALGPARRAGIDGFLQRLRQAKRTGFDGPAPESPR